MISKSIQFGGSSIAQEHVTVVNRINLATTNTAALTVGGVYAFDIAGTDTNTASLGDQLGAVVPVAAANAHGVLVVADAAVAAGKQGEAVVSGVVSARVNGTTAAGTKLYATTSQNYLGIASSATSLPVGVALTARTTSTTAVMNVLFSGFVRV